MSKFNTPAARPAVSSPVVSEPTASTVTHEGAPGFARDAKSELFLLSVTNMVSEQTFYESARDRDSRYSHLLRTVTSEDPEWVAAFLRWLRTEANMRSASLVGAAEFARQSLADGRPGARQVVASVLQRADEPGEMLAYWTSTSGRALPKPVKRGVADAATRLYDERALLKYDAPGKGFRFGDVIDLVHPSPRAPWQGDLFAHALDRRHGRDNPIPASLDMLYARQALMAIPVAERRAMLTGPDGADRLRQGGMTWEAVAGWLQGPMDAAAWQAVIPSMGYMALLRNLRNFDQAGIPDDVASTVAARLSDPEQVARSRQFPMRFLSAYKAAPSLRWAYALEKALNLSLANVPALPGRSLILVDMSGSMYAPLSARSDLLRSEAGAIFGSALAVRCEQADLVQFGTGHAPVEFGRAESVLRIVQRFTAMGGTNTAEAVRANLRPEHKRVVIVTDEQAWAGFYGGDPTAQVPAGIPVYTWNLAGYRAGHGPSGTGNRHTFGGLTDAAFRMVPLLEAGRNADWPWLGAS